MLIVWPDRRNADRKRIFVSKFSQLIKKPIPRIGFHREVHNADRILRTRLRSDGPPATQAHYGQQADYCEGSTVAFAERHIRTLFDELQC
jgi:hypothetical protein